MQGGFCVNPRFSGFVVIHKMNPAGSGEEDFFLNFL
jgi:hypothetical protein